MPQDIDARVLRRRWKIAKMVIHDYECVQTYMRTLLQTVDNNDQLRAIEYTIHQNRLQLAKLNQDIRAYYNYCEETGIVTV